MCTRVCVCEERSIRTDRQTWTVMGMRCRRLVWPVSVAVMSRWWQDDSAAWIADVVSTVCFQMWFMILCPVVQLGHHSQQTCCSVLCAVVSCQHVWETKGDRDAAA